LGGIATIIYPFKKSLYAVAVQIFFQMIDNGADDAGSNGEGNPPYRWPSLHVKEGMQFIVCRIISGEKPEGGNKNESAKELPEEVLEGEFVENALHADILRF